MSRQNVRLTHLFLTWIFEFVISFFTSLKSFQGTTAIQQRNALMSWRAVIPNCEIIVFGAVGGGDDVLAEVNTTYRPDIECNDFGTPLISAMFAESQHIGRHEILCYINGDIILLSDFVKAILRLKDWRRFVAIGQRWDIDWDKPIDFTRRWEETLQSARAASGRQSAPVAMDYFAFRTGVVSELPPFAIGRPCWDNYLVMHLCRRRVPIVDLSQVVAPIHQNHDYRHVQKGRNGSWEGPEADRNRALASRHWGGFHPRFHSITSAQWVMTERLVLPALSPQRAAWRFMSLVPDGLRDFGHKLADLLPRSAQLLRRLTDFYLSAFPFRLLLRDPSRVAVVRTDNIGDFILWLDGARAIRNHYPRPEYRLILIAAAGWSNFAEASGLFDEVVAVDPTRFSTIRRYCRQLSRKVARYRFTTAVNPTFSRSPWIDDFLLRATGASVRIGYAGDLSNASNLTRRITDRWYTRLIPPDEAATHELEKNRHFARSFDASAELRTPKLEPAMVQQPAWLPAAGDYFVLFPSAAWPIKRWPVERFGEIARRIHANAGWSGVVCGPSSDSSAADTLIAHADGVPITNACGRTTLQELAGVIAEAHLIVTNDTSAAHLAAALERPVIALLGGGHFGRFLPYPDLVGSTVRTAYRSMPCYQCNWHCVHPLQPNDPGPCIAAITVDDVWARIEPMLSLSRESATPNRVRDGSSPQRGNT